MGFFHWPFGKKPKRDYRQSCEASDFLASLERREVSTATAKNAPPTSGGGLPERVMESSTPIMSSYSGPTATIQSELYPLASTVQDLCKLGAKHGRSVLIVSLGDFQRIDRKVVDYFVGKGGRRQGSRYDTCWRAAVCTDTPVYCRRCHTKIPGKMIATLRLRSDNPALAAAGALAFHPQQSEDRCPQCGGQDVYYVFRNPEGPIQEKPWWQFWRE